jgi:hypothetical protein
MIKEIRRRKKEGNDVGERKDAVERKGGRR